MADQLDDEGCMRLLAAVTLQWWRDCDEPGELAKFLEMPVDAVVSERPQRIDGWRRKVVERSWFDVLA